MQIASLISCSNQNTAQISLAQKKGLKLWFSIGSAKLTLILIKISTGKSQDLSYYDHYYILYW